MKCPMCPNVLVDPTFCPACLTRIERNDRGEVERAVRRNPLHDGLQVVFQRRPNAASALEPPGQRCANTRYPSETFAPLDGFQVGTDRPPRKAAA